ncbi:MAG: N-acetyltransferase [Deltaproteobacteria bacterium]|nr:N-acetyltransferase [Deltaproteobacteria bacterium]
MSQQHSNSYIHQSAKLHPSVTVGSFCHIGQGVEIGEGSIVGHHVVIHNDTKIGARVRIDDHAVLGKSPMKAINSATTTIKPLPPLEIGNDCLIGTAAIIYRGARLGPKCLVADLGGVREEVTIGEGTIIGRGAYVENQSSVGRFVKLETMVYIAAYSTIGDRCFVAPMVTVTNDNFVGRTKERFDHFKGVTIERGGRVGANATLLPGAVIEEDALVAAGSIVRGHAPARKISLGQPARVIRDVPEPQLLENQGWPDVIPTSNHTPDGPGRR